MFLIICVPFIVRALLACLHAMYRQAAHTECFFLVLNSLRSFAFMYIFFASSFMLSTMPNLLRNVNFVLSYVIIYYRDKYCNKLMTSDDM
jgi:hypothetical protein